MQIGKNNVSMDLERNNLKEIQRIKSSSNLVMICENDLGKLVIAKIYRNKYFPKQAEYEQKIYTHLINQKFYNVPLFEKTVFLEASNIYCNIFEYKEYADLTKSRDTSNSLIKKFAKVINELHKIDIPLNLIEMHPQQAQYPLNFLTQNTLNKLKNLYGYNIPKNYLEIPNSSKKGLVFSHRDPNYNHILKNKSDIYLVDFEDCGAFPKQVDFASFLKDLIEYGANNKTIEFYLKETRNSIIEIWPYLVRNYLIDFAYLSNRTYLKFREFWKIIEATNDPVISLKRLVRLHETNMYCR